MRKEHHSYAMEHVTQRVIDEQHFICQQSPGESLETIINETLQAELNRLRSEPPSRKNLKQLVFWKDVQKRLPYLDQEDQEALLREIVERFTREILGGFREGLYSLASKVLPFGFKALLQRFSLKQYFSDLGSRSLKQNLEVSGPIDHIKALAKHGTLVFTPNHLSNLDSVILGYGLYKEGLPPVVYGAGLNLFKNPIISFLMTNLGAYTVDRNKKSPLYKSVLKTYAALTMELGYHNLFFPGGTRNRQGEMDHRLKLGLLGSAMSAYQRCVLRDEQDRRFFVVPCTINYNLVLEANPLITDYLKQVGASRFIDIRRSVARPIRLLRFLRNVQTLQSRIHLRLGEPMDLFGNRVDTTGTSLDPQGNIVDTTRYFFQGDKLVVDDQRNQAYTTELGHRILNELKCNNVLMSTNIVAFTVFQLLRRQHPEMDLFAFLRPSPTVPFVSLERVIELLQKLMVQLQEAHQRGCILLDDDLVDLSAEDMLHHALKQFDTFHGRRVLQISQRRVFSHHLKLIYYYANKLNHYDLERVFDDTN